MRKIILGAIVMLIVVVASCSSKETLANKIAGKWTSTTEKLYMPDTDMASATMTYNFSHTQGENGGTVTVTAMLAASRPISPSGDAALEPIQVTVSGVATIQGTWKATGNDEIFMMLEMKTLDVTVDPEAVELIYNNLTDESAPSIETLRAGITEQFQKEFTAEMQQKLISCHAVEDIDIHDGIMEWEINDHDYKLMRSE